MKEQEKKALAKAKEQEKKQKAQDAKLAKEAEKKKKEDEKLAAKEAARLAKEKEQEEKKASKKGKAQEEEAPKKPGRPAKEANSDDDLVGSDDGDWEEEEIIDIDEIESEKRDFSIDDELKDNLVGDILSRADGDSLREIFNNIRDPKFFSAGVDECLESTERLACK